MPKTIQQISADSPYQDLDTNVLDLIDYVGATELRTNFQYRSIYDTVYRLCVAIGNDGLTNGIPYYGEIEDTVNQIISYLLFADQPYPTYYAVAQGGQYPDSLYTPSGYTRVMLRQSAFGARKPIAKIRLIYANDYNASGGEVYPTNDITIKAALENPAGTLTVPVTFGGASSKVIPSGQLAYSDEILPSAFGLSEFPANWNPFPRTECDVPSGGKWPWNNISGPARPAGTAIVHCSSSDVSQVNNTGAFTVPAGGTAITYAGFGVVGIIGEYVDEPDIAIFLNGTSIDDGLGDSIYNGTTGGGALKRGIAAVGQIPWINCCRSGEQAVNWTTAGKRNTNRKILMGYCTHMYSGNGSNDLLSYTTAETYTALQAKYADFRAKAKGAKYIIQGPVIPRTDAGNTTPATDFGVGQERDTFNAYVLAQTGKANCHDDFVDLNSLMDSGAALWASSSYTTDGVHPVTTGYIAMAPALTACFKYLTKINTLLMPSVVAHFDVSKPWTITQSGGAISQFRDIISRGANYFAATSTAQPTYNATGLDGTLPAVTFDGNDVMTALTTITASGGYDVFAVMKVVAATGTNRTILSSNIVGGFQMLINTTNKIQISKRQSSVLSFGTNTITAGKHVLESESQSSNTLIRGVVDGTQDGISTNPPTFTEGIVYLGGRGTAEYLNTDAVAEIIVCDKSLMSATDRANIYAHFASKWGT